jgi:rare lipoprotein A
MRSAPILLAFAFLQLTGADAAFAQSSRGQASYYFYPQPTASGERFRPEGLTAAHRSLPFGTRVRVTHMRSKKSVVVRIDDRGPFVRGRIIDVSRGAARQLGMLAQGVAPVQIEVLN